MGYTSLMYAAQYNSNAAVVEELINKGAAVDLPDAMARTPLILAAAYNKNPQVVKALIDHGADVNVTSRDYYNVGWTPLMYAAASDHDPLAKVAFLLAAGANARVRSKEGKLALDYARGNNLVSQEDHVYRLLEEASNSY
jgi:ankyrin repeat protein